MGHGWQPAKPVEDLSSESSSDSDETSSQGVRKNLRGLATLLLAFNPAAPDLRRADSGISPARRSVNGARRVSSTSIVAAAHTPTSVPNFRDLGLTPCSHGIIRPGVLLRSASPSNISAADATALDSIRTVLDLRLEHDAKRDAGPRRLASKTQHVSLLTEGKVRKALLSRARSYPILLSKLIGLVVLKKVAPSRHLRERLGMEADKRLASLLNVITLADTYEFILEHSTDDLLAAFKLCAADDALPMLVHCTHGKDRTGVLVALLLVACGVSEDDIVEDYARSHDWGCSIEGIRAMRAAFPDRVQPFLREDLIEEWCEAPEGQIRELFRRIERKHGSMTGYLDSIGVDESFRKELASKFTMASKPEPQPLSTK